MSPLSYSSRLFSQWEEERQLNYSFSTATNDRQNINLKEATFKDIAEEKKNDITNEDEQTKEDKFVEETKSDHDDNREVEPPKRDFGVICLVTNCN